MRTVGLALTLLLLGAPSALAQVHDGGEGIWGPADDKVITDAGFLVIAAIPLFIFLMSTLQFLLDRRKDRRKAAKKQAAAGHWPGGW